MKKKRSHSSHKTPFQSKSSKASTLSFPARLNKYIAHCGVCSRRKAVDFVRTGQVTVNGNIILEPYFQVEEKDRVKLKGKLIKPERHLIYILYNKPKNVICTTSDEKGRLTVIDAVGYKGPERIYPVGRLDRDTTGLILITNDGELATKLAHPSNNVMKKYIVSLFKPLAKTDEEAIKKGVPLEDGIVPVDAIYFKNPENRKKVELTIHVGRNRIIRRLFETLGYEIRHLERNYYAGLTTKNLFRGKSRNLTNREKIMLRHFIK